MSLWEARGCATQGPHTHLRLASCDCLISVFRSAFRAAGAAAGAAGAGASFLTGCCRAGAAVRLLCRQQGRLM